MIDVDLELSVSDGRRRFDLSVRFATDVPFAALYGPSGSGKSLTLQAIAGLLPPSRGHVRLNGRTLYDASRQVNLAPPARRIGYLFQHYALFPHLSVRDNVSFGLQSWWQRRLPSADRARVQQLLDRFDLTPLAESRPHSLSGGQQQRVALARAMACEPQVLLLDEPFAALNPMLRAALRQDLARVRKEWGIPALMITHDVDDVLELADAVFVYDNGQIVREINVQNGDSRALTRRALGMPVPDEAPLRQKLRRLLAAASGNS